MIAAWRARSSPVDGPAIGPVVLCADDFALSEGISEAIVALVRARVLSAASCMSAAPSFHEHAVALAPFRDKVDLGLHFTLTELGPLGPMPELAPSGKLPTFAQLARAAYTRTLRPSEIRAELLRQLDAFESAFGAPPAFVDGHHHVHQLRGVREVVVDVLRTRPGCHGVYLRVCDESPAVVVARGVSVARALLIGAPGVATRALARRHGIDTNDGFGGVYDFTLDVPYAQRFERFLHGMRPHSIVLCHPGLPSHGTKRADPIAAAREAEMRFLAGPELAATLARARVRIGRFR